MPITGFEISKRKQEQSKLIRQMEILKAGSYTRYRYFGDLTENQVEDMLDIIRARLAILRAELKDIIIAPRGPVFGGN